jgi:hypothetical protein
MRTLHGLGIVILTVAAGGVGLLPAQTTLATVAGMVLDSNGAVIPAVKIELTNTDTNI